MDSNTAFYIVSRGSPHLRQVEHRVGPAFDTLQQAARALGFLRTRMPVTTRLHIEQDVISGD